MCGIAGIYNFKGEKIDTIILRNMCDIEKHRGPDDEGYVLINTKNNLLEERQGIDTNVEVKKGLKIIEEENKGGFNLGFGSRRLSIIDLSSNAHQPMCNEDGNIWITYNGEIYNYLEIMDYLKVKGHRFRSNSDVEVIIHLYEERGEECLKEFNGMFAFAIWDVRKKKLFCARDRFGIKPFYYYLDKDKFIFASEIKAIFENKKIKRIPNDDVIFKYLNDNYIPYFEETFFANVKQLPPAHYLVIDINGFRVVRWWDIPDLSLHIEYKDALIKFYELFEDSIRLRLRSDVPIGTCLSGGLDSSSIVCVLNNLLKRQTTNFSQKAFSSCFENKNFDEREYINQVVEKTNIKNFYTFPDEKKLFNELPKIIWHQDEPFVSTSIFAQWEVMKLAKSNDVVVLLDGQGGDELLAGYHGYYYSFFADLIRNFKIVKLIKEISLYNKYHKYSILDALIRATLYALPFGFKKLFKKILYKKQNYHSWLNIDVRKLIDNRWELASKFKGILKKHLYVNLVSYLPSLLRFEDRNSMAFSLESRLPFLDFRLVEFVFSLENSTKINDGMTKIILRDSLKEILPEKVRLRKDKMAFGTPESIWFKTTLKDKIKDIILSEEFKRRGYINQDKIRVEFEKYCNNEKEITNEVWRWVNFELWYRICIEEKK